MADEIVNRVANSKLVTFNLEDYYPEGTRYQLDIAPWLLEGIVLREKDFRKFVKEHDWSVYRNGFLALNCATDAIIPAWAYMLITVEASKHARKVVRGSLEELETVLLAEIIDTIPLEEFRNKPVIVKGCAAKPIPTNAYLLVIQKLQTVASSIMYGEACSSVPLFKRK